MIIINEDEQYDRCKCCCPICGYDFGEYEDIKDEGNVCPTGHTGWGTVFGRDDLIGEDDDYLWCQ